MFGVLAPTKPARRVKGAGEFGPAATKPRVVRRRAKSGELAQLGERLLCKQEVTGSIPVFSTKLEASAEPSGEMQ